MVSSGRLKAASLNEMRCSFPKCIDVREVALDTSCSFVGVELELGGRVLEFSRVVEKFDSDDSDVQHLETFCRD